MRATEIELLDVYRLAKGALASFNYLEENSYILTKFNEHNFFVGSFSEDRPNFFRLLFKGYKGSGQ